MSKADDPNYVGKIAALKGLMVEVEVLGAKPEENELLSVEGLNDVFLEVSFFTDSGATCVNIDNSFELRCGLNVSRTKKKVSVPVGPKTLGRVFNALGEPLDNGPEIKENRRVVTEPSGIKSYRKSPQWPPPDRPWNEWPG